MGTVVRQPILDRSNGLLHVKDNFHSGATVADLYTNMATDRTLIEGGYHGVTVFVMCNDMAKKKNQYSGEPQAFEDHMVNIFALLREKTPRPFVVFGGSARLWNFPEAYGALAAKYVNLGRRMGVPCVDGVHFLDQCMYRDGWHMTNVDHNHRIIEEWVWSII